MRHLKTYETHYHNEPNEGDYVICKQDDYARSPAQGSFLNDFYQSTIGKIIYININIDKSKTYKVEYEIPEDKKWFFKQYKQSKITRQIFDRDEILYYSKNREYLETILAANKYNL